MVLRDVLVKLFIINFQIIINLFNYNNIFLRDYFRIMIQKMTRVYGYKVILEIVMGSMEEHLK